MVNQIEIHPFFQQNTALRVMEDYGVIPQAWGPFSEAQKDIFNHRALAKIAGRHGKTTAQVILRWHLQRNIPTIPKTVHRERMAENLDVFDFGEADGAHRRNGHRPQRDHRPSLLLHGPAAQQR